ncbi:hypothetical protein FNF27_01337 [Cafeteria roenbergensis]|uniref:HP domain-containing protein n=1 Tax=Cafeteria roenbergensis TaxID=33653 RepID=A0A5A8EK28_CAFRO|nr:hypothetical protein FNF31_02559 [Cafeteria roenbergensis]KAA0177007.1 hypothetical protein FNF27_01337 [Cafeteria roenbergensis]
MSLQETLGEASAAFSNGDYETALSKFDEVLLEASEESHATLHFNRGLCLSKMGHSTDAEEAIRSCLELDPARAVAWHNLGALLLAKDDDAGAADAFDRAIESAAEAGSAEQLKSSRTARAQMHKQAGELEAALALYQLVVDQCEEEGVAAPNAVLCQRGEVYCRAEDWEAAAASYQASLDAHGALTSDADTANFGLALFNAGRGQHEAGSIDAAEALYLRCLDCGRPTHALHNLAVMYMQNGRSAEAEPLLREVIGADPTHSLALTALGTWLAQEGRYEEAVPVLRMSASAAADAGDDATRHEVLRAMGVSCFKLKRYAEAIEAFQVVAEADPSNTHAVNGLKLSKDALARGEGVKAPDVEPAVGRAHPPPKAAAPAPAPAPAAARAASTSFAGAAASRAPAPAPPQAAPRPAAAKPAAAAASGDDDLPDPTADGHLGVVAAYDDLKAVPYPAGVDPRHREAHLTLAEFHEVVGMDKAAFYAQPKWKQVQQKKKLQLF